MPDFTSLRQLRGCGDKAPMYPHLRAVDSVNHCDACLTILAQAIERERDELLEMTWGIIAPRCYMSKWSCWLMSRKTRRCRMRGWMIVDGRNLPDAFDYRLPIYWLRKLAKEDQAKLCAPESRLIRVLLEWPLLE